MDRAALALGRTQFCFSRPCGGESRVRRHRGACGYEGAGSPRQSNPCLLLLLSPWPPPARTRPERRVCALLRVERGGSFSPSSSPRPARGSRRAPTPPCSCSSGAGCWPRLRCSWSSSSSQTSQRSKKKSGILEAEVQSDQL